MTPLDLYHDLTDAGFSLRLEDGRLMVSPGSKLSGEQREAIATHRNDLVRCLLPWRTTHLGLPAVLLEVDGDGVPWYRAWRRLEPGPVCVPCLVRGSMLDVPIPAWEETECHPN